MSVANKEFILNYTTNRWGLNKKKNVGPTSDSIRLCNPTSIEEWNGYYFANVRSLEHIKQLGDKLYSLISTILPNEKRFHPELLESITQEDCINYMIFLVINRTYTGFCKERGIV